MFVQVVRLGGFSAAARQLGSSAGQASKLVSALEARLGVRLLNRTTRATALTPEGEEYFARIATILDQIDDLDESLRISDTDPHGLLRITAPLSFGAVQLMPALAQFAGLYPGIALDVNFTDSIVSLAEHGVDVAIRIGEPRDSSLRMRKLGQMQIQFVAAPDYLAQNGTPLVPEELSRHAIITDTNFSRPNDWQFAHGQTLTLTGRLRFSNAEACISAALAGLGIAHVPDVISAPIVRSGRLVDILQDRRPAPVPIHALSPPGRHMPQRLRLLIDFLQSRWGPTHDWAIDSK